MKFQLRTHVAALMLLAPMAAMVASPATAQNAVVRAQPTITSMALNADHGLSPGSTLRFQLNAAPRARSATMTLGDSGIRVALRERSPGIYQGTHVVRRADRIDPTEFITARVTHGQRTVAQNFSYPAAFQALAMGAPAAPAPSIDRFVLRGAGNMEPGRELRFRLHGAPGADAWLDIPGVAKGVDLAETRPGVYEGTYTIRRRDDPNAFERAVATLQSGGQRSTARVDVRGRDDDERDERRSDRGDRDLRVPLEVTSHRDNAVVDANGNLALQGRTLPNATVRVQVESVASIGGLLGVSQPVADQTVQADRNGRFLVAINPRGLPIPGTRYDIRLTATSGGQSAEERLTLVQRQG
jgi:hypothetical protein